MKLKASFITFKGYSLKKLKQFFLECESATLSLQTKNIKIIFANLSDKLTQIQLDKIILIHVMKQSYASQCCYQCSNFTSRRHERVSIFICLVCRVLKNTYFKEHLSGDASKYIICDTRNNTQDSKLCSMFKHSPNIKGLVYDPNGIQPQWKRYYGPKRHGSMKYCFSKWYL